MLGSNSEPSPASRRCGTSTDEQLARAAGRGDVAAFEALYVRYHLQLLSFSRHMVGRVHDAEDVVQHTFMAADRTFRSGKAPKSVRAWLYTVARNRCISLLRARREEHDLPDAGLASTENLAADVEQRADLRDLLDDLRALPEDQRAALLLSELGDLSHAEVADVIGVRRNKVKALVFQARQNLMASADARAIPCHAIREELAAATGASLRRKRLRNHLARCEECTAYSARVRAQRASLAAVLPVVPTLALRDSVLGAIGSGGAAAAGAGIGGAGAGIGMLAAKSTAAKVLAIAAVGGAAAGGGTVAVSAIDSSPSGGATEREAEQRRSVPAPAGPGAAAGPSGDSPVRVVPGRAGEAAPAATRDRPRGTARRAEHGRKGGDRRPGSRRDAAPGQAKRSEKAAPAPGSRGRAVGKVNQPARERPAAPAQSRRPEGAGIAPPRRAAADAAPAPRTRAQPAERAPTLPAKARPAEPAPVEAAVPVAEAKRGNAANARVDEGIPTQ